MLAFRWSRRSPSGLQQVEDLEGGGGDDRGEGVGEEVRAGALAQQGDDLGAGCDVAAGGAAEGLAEGAGDDVDAVHDAVQLGGAAAAGADEADRVRVVDHHHGVVPLGQVADLGERGDVAVHREDAVGDDELAAGAALGRLLELLLQVGHVAVGVAEAAGLGEADAVDDRGVVEGVGDDGVLGAEDRLEDAAVGVEAGGVEDRVLLAEEGREAGLQLLVHLLRAADEADGRHAVAPAVERRVGGGDDLGVVGQAQVVVGAEVQDLAGATARGDGDGGRLGVPITRSGLWSPAWRISSRVARMSSRTESNMGQAPAVQSRMILPLLPEAASSKAAS